MTSGSGGNINMYGGAAGTAINIGSSVGSQASAITINIGTSTNAAVRTINIGTGTTSAYIVAIGSTIGSVGFYGATAVVQATTAEASSVFVANAGTAINSLSTFDGYTLAQIVKLLRNLGLAA